MHCEHLVGVRAGGGEIVNWWDILLSLNPCIVCLFGLDLCSGWFTVCNSLSCSGDLCVFVCVGLCIVYDDGILGSQVESTDEHECFGWVHFECVPGAY